MNKPGYYYNTYNDTFFIIFNDKVIVDSYSKDDEDVSWYESVIHNMYLKKHKDDLFLGCL